MEGRKCPVMCLFVCLFVCFQAEMELQKSIYGLTSELERARAQLEQLEKDKMEIGSELVAQKLMVTKGREGEERER